MKKVTVDKDYCKGCNLCVSVCPKKIMQLDLTSVNSRGYNLAYCTDQDKCISCAMCAMICPESAITVEKE